MVVKGGFKPSSDFRVPLLKVSLTVAVRGYSTPKPKKPNTRMPYRTYWTLYIMLSFVLRAVYIHIHIHISRRARNPPNKYSTDHIYQTFPTPPQPPDPPTSHRREKTIKAVQPDTSSSPKRRREGYTKQHGHLRQN